MSIHQRNNLLLLKKLLNKIREFLWEALQRLLKPTWREHWHGKYTFWKYWKSLSKIEFKELFYLSTKDFYFLFNGRFLQQVDGVAMGPHLGPALVNVFLVYFEKNWLQNCPSDFKPRYYRRYVDDIFVLFTS